MNRRRGKKGAKPRKASPQSAPTGESAGSEESGTQETLEVARNLTSSARALGGDRGAKTGSGWGTVPEERITRKTEAVTSSKKGPRHPQGVKITRRTGGGGRAPDKQAPVGMHKGSPITIASREEMRKRSGGAVKRYQAWEYTGAGRFKPLWPLPSHFTPDYYIDVEYDAAGKVPVTIEEYLKDQDEPLVRKPIYNEEGQVQYSDFDDPEDDLKGRNMYEYDERNMLCARQEKAPDGTIRFRTISVVDDNGHFVEETLTRKGSKIEKRVYEYDQRGLLLKDAVYPGPKCEKLEGFFVMGYDKKGRLTRRAWHGTEGEERNAFRYTYDEHDLQITMGIENDGKVVITCHTELDDKGVVKRLEYVDDGGKPLARETVGPDGQVMTEHHMDLDPEQFYGSMPDEVPTENLQEALKPRKEDLAALAQLAFSNFEKGLYEQSRSLFESLVALSPGDPYFLAGVAASAFNMDQFKSALLWYDRALTHTENHLPSLVGKAETLLRLGRTDEALEAFRQVFENADAMDDPLVMRARALVTAMSQRGATETEN